MLVKKLYFVIKSFNLSISKISEFLLFCFLIISSRHNFTETTNPTSIVETLQDTSITPAELSLQKMSQNPSFINETSQEISNTLVDNATEKTSVTFSFQLHPATKMKQAVECLCDENFNPQGLGMFEVDKDGLEITVLNAESTAVGHLWLKATGLIDFTCNKEMIKKWVNLNDIFKILVDSSDEDTVTIHHLDGSNQLVFSFGSTPPTQFSVELLELDGSYEKFPKIIFACDAVILSDHLREMIEVFQAALIEGPELVTASISETVLILCTGKANWPYSYILGDKVNGIRGLKGKQEHHAWFQWPHCKFLKKASFLTRAFLLCFVTDPPKRIMLRFNLRELGDLVYLNDTTLTLFDSHEMDGIKFGLGQLASAASLV